MNLKLKGKIIEKFGTQLQFSKLVEENETFISLVVRGWRNLTEEKKEKWANLLGCKKDELFS